MSFEVFGFGLVGYFAFIYKAFLDPYRTLIEPYNPPFTILMIRRPTLRVHVSLSLALKGLIF